MDCCKVPFLSKSIVTGRAELLCCLLYGITSQCAALSTMEIHSFNKCRTSSPKRLAFFALITKHMTTLDKSSWLSHGVALQSLLQYRATIYLPAICHIMHTSTFGSTSKTKYNVLYIIYTWKVIQCIHDTMYYNFHHYTKSLFMQMEKQCVSLFQEKAILKCKRFFPI